MSRLQNKIALVTGGNTGIGRAVCLAYAREGAKIVVAWHQQQDQMLSLAQEIQSNGGVCIGIEADITIENDVVALFNRAEDEIGVVDILVNNAGIQKSQPIMDMSVADFDNMLKVHLRGAFMCSREAVRQMQHHHPNGTADVIVGRIINVCSQLGYIGRANYTAYATAKGGMIAFTRALAKELAPLGILVNGVSPGLVDTGFDPLSADAKQAHADALPLQRLGTVQDMTSAFVFLASDDAAYYCGQLMHPNGGEIMP